MLSISFPDFLAVRDICISQFLQRDRYNSYTKSIVLSCVKTIAVIGHGRHRSFRKLLVHLLQEETITSELYKVSWWRIPHCYEIRVFI